MFKLQKDNFTWTFGKFPEIIYVMNSIIYIGMIFCYIPEFPASENKS